MKNIYAKIEGIHCASCEIKISEELLKNNKIKTVKIKNNIAHITYEGNISHREIIDCINNMDYICKEEYISNNLNDLDTNIKLKEFIIITTAILVTWFLINKIFEFNIFSVIPKIENSITYPMLFITGILTSIHCISMCGAINLTATIGTKTNLKKPLLYNLGRIISYTIIGGIAGTIGNIISINDTVSGIVILIASILMFLMSLSMLGILKIKVLKLNTKAKTKNAFILGVLNGLMPCGPLQAMQIYALSTGDFIKGTLSMLLFGLGTVPLMLSIGIIYNLFKGKRRIIINKIASVLILILSIVMLNRGLLTLNIDISKHFNQYSKYTRSKIENNIQIAEFELSYNSYEDIIVQVGIPVKMIIHVDEKSLTGCNYQMIMQDFNIIKTLEIGDNIIEFTPNKTGTYTYTCWMEMIKNNIKVIDGKSYFEEGK